MHSSETRNRTAVTWVVQRVLDQSPRTSTCIVVKSQNLVNPMESLQPNGLSPNRLLCPWDFPEYIMRNAGLDEAQAGIKTARRNINNLRYADDSTLMAESEEKLRSLLKKVKEKSEKVGLKLNIQKTKIMASGPITSWQIDGETMETVTDFILRGFKITADDCKMLPFWKRDLQMRPLEGNAADTSSSPSPLIRQLHSSALSDPQS
ncbi:uncharacterized protein ACBT57_010622 [Dama dama]